MNKIIKITAVVILVAGLIFIGYLLFKGKTKEATEVIKAEEKKETENAKKKEATLPVKVLKIGRGDLPLRLRVSATADVWEKSIIRSEVSGKVKKIYCKVGDWVKKGQLLVKIDDVEKKLDVESKKAFKLQTLSKFLVKESIGGFSNTNITEEQKKELEKIKAKYKNAVKDFERGKISEVQLEKINEEYEKSLVFSGALREEVLKATENLTDAIINLKKAELDLERTSIRSPFEGKISDLKVSTGEIININQEVLKVVNLNSLYLKGFALESEIGKLKKGIKVRIKFDSFPDKFFYGELDAISPEVDTDKKTITVYIKVDNKEKLILPGMHAEIDVEYKVYRDVIKVPRKAIIIRQERPLVFIIKDRTALWAYVELGEKNDEEQEIKKFVNPEYGVGDQVVVEGHLTLAHQSRVRIIK